MSRIRTAALTSLAMIAFAGNSLLCRAALLHTHIDPSTFTSVRLLSGAVALWLIVRTRGGAVLAGGSWPSALALFAYAATFSFAYVGLAAATGALLLFGAVQATMIGRGLWAGERLRALQWTGFSIALAGLVGLLLPGLSAPPPAAALCMLVSGVAWGVYSLRGKGAGDAASASAGNFARAVPLALALSLVTLPGASPDAAGLAYAVLSGAVASAGGYIVWYSVLPALHSTTAATVQLSVPVIAAVGGMLFLGEPASLRIALASIAILGGIGLVTTQSAKRTV